MARKRKLSAKQEQRICEMLLDPYIKRIDIASSFGITPSMVTAIARRNGIGDIRHRWTPEEDELLVCNYKKLGAKKLAFVVFAETHPSVAAIQRRASHLGITDHDRYYRRGDADV